MRRKFFSEILDTKGGGTNFSGLGWGKRKGEPKLVQIPRGMKSLLTVN